MTSVDLRLGAYRDVLADVQCDALIVDAPYSAKTHEAHNGAADDANRGKDYRARVERPTGGTGPRSAITYDAWDALDVAEFCAFWAPRVRGWWVTITDHVLAPIWTRAFEHHGLYAFSPLAFVASGSRVRLAGDGPAQWSCFIVVGRPRVLPFSKWGSLPGAYVLPKGQDNRRGDALDVTGGKPLWLMQSLVRDYSRGGDTVCDPCAGGGTTLLAAAIEGRSAVGAECMPEHYELAQKRLARGYTPTLFG